MVFGANYRSSNEINDATWLSRARIEPRWSLWPRRCWATRRWLWLRPAIKTTCIWTGPGDAVVEDRWYDTRTVMLLLLKGKKNGSVR